MEDLTSSCRELTVLGDKTAYTSTSVLKSADRTIKYRQLWGTAYAESDYWYSFVRFLLLSGGNEILIIAMACLCCVPLFSYSSEPS
ncbi:hypothetical protein NPIL_5691 [Nephila pilipes]|uniref:Uncharacterized protein n=1 Tax=Nephila pilipes TaxID=299642 RepID=A0A8X6QVC5_NEPPI|nr:hypothetical protein NPIL_5691 [Nephila pilipes]